jgi:hypothetical protein
MLQHYWRAFSEKPRPKRPRRARTRSAFYKRMPHNGHIRTYATQISVLGTRAILGLSTAKMCRLADASSGLIT